MVTVTEVDPMNGSVRILLDNEEIWLPVDELSNKPPQAMPDRKRRKTKTTTTAGQATLDAKDDHDIVDQDEHFDFSVFVREDGFSFKVGTVCFFESCSFPVLLDRIFRHKGKVFVSGIRCQCDGSKVVSLIRDFVVTVECSYLVRVCPSNEYNVSCVSQQVSVV